MPLALAPSNVFAPAAEAQGQETEAQSQYVAYSVESSFQPYWGQMEPAPTQIINSAQPSIHEQLNNLRVRLAVLGGDTPATRAAPAAKASFGGLDGVSFDSYAKFAGEAHKVRATGRLPFGSDNKKLAL